MRKARDSSAAASDYRVVSRIEEGTSDSVTSTNRNDDGDNLMLEAAELQHYHDAVESDPTKDRDGLMRLRGNNYDNVIVGTTSVPVLTKQGATDEVNDENDDDDDLGSFVTAIDQHSASHYNTTFVGWLASHSTTTLWPDDCFTWRGIVWAEGEFAIKLAKFTGLTFGGIVAMFYVVRWMKWENDESLRLADVWRYEGNLIITDALFFFVVGRLHRQRGVDHLAWLAWCLAANFYSSYITGFRMFRHSFTPYEMHCTWPWQLWAFFVLVIPIVATVAIWHVQHAWQTRVLVQKSVEMIFCVTFLLLPLVTSPYFHFHHWFAGLLVGMHFNFDVWWSRASMAWCWGQYINGIAVYGRDPVLTCAYAYFMSTTQRCPYVDCYLEALHNPNHMFDNVTVTPMKPPNWHNCSADAYHP